jgi:hypothetical protein
VVEDGGEIIIYAPHIDSFSRTHGRVLDQIGYHVRDYYLKQMDKFARVPKVVMAISTYVKGSGRFENGIEQPRIRVAVASQIPEAKCRQAGLGYYDPRSIRFEEWRNREEDGILFVEKAGETLFRPADEKQEPGTGQKH